MHQSPNCRVYCVHRNTTKFLQVKCTLAHRSAARAAHCYIQRGGGGAVPLWLRDSSDSLTERRLWWTRYTSRSRLPPAAAAAAAAPGYFPVSLHLSSLATLNQPKSHSLPNSVLQILFYVSILLSLIGVFKSSAWHAETPLKIPKQGTLSDSRGSMHFIPSLPKTSDHPLKRPFIIGSLSCSSINSHSIVAMVYSLLWIMEKIKNWIFFCVLPYLEIKVAFSYSAG